MITPSFDQMSFTESNNTQDAITINTVSSISQQQLQTQELIDYGQGENNLSNSNDLMLIPLARLPGFFINY